MNLLPYKINMYINSKWSKWYYHPVFKQTKERRQNRFKWYKELNDR